MLSATDKESSQLNPVHLPSHTLHHTDDDFASLLRHTTGSATSHAAESPVTQYLDALLNDVDEVDLANDEKLPLAERKAKLQHIFSAAASDGDAKRVSKMLTEIPPGYVDVNAKEADGNGATPLIFAACFGHLDVAFLLLETAGIEVDRPDNSGWTALTWATNNNHDSLVRLLLDHGATTTTKTSKGRTVLDFATHSSNTMAALLRDDELNTAADDHDTHGADLPYSSGFDFYSSGTVDDEALQAERNFMFRVAMENVSGLEKESDESTVEAEEDVAQSSEEEDIINDAEAVFDWDQCLPGQMFVYDPKDLGKILEVFVENMKPTRSKFQKPVPANAIFLSARYAHYLCNDAMLQDLLASSVGKIRRVIERCQEDMIMNAFWLANSIQLLFYLRRDPGVAAATAHHQSELEHLITEIYQHLICDSEKRLHRVLDASILTYEPISGLKDGTKYEREKRGLFGLGVSLTGGDSANVPQWVTGGRAGAESNTATPTSYRAATVNLIRQSTLYPKPHQDPRLSRCASPRTITTLLSSVLFVLQTYRVESTITHHILSQLLYYLSVVTFNRIITTYTHRCRSKAMQIRMNISAIEDWIRANRLPPQHIDHFRPLIQLLQLLQCLTRLTDLSMFLEVKNDLDLITPVQIRKIVEGYRYEVGENKLSEEVQQYVAQVAEDTTKRDKTEKALEAESRRNSAIVDRRNDVEVYEVKHAEPSAEAGCEAEDSVAVAGSDDICKGLRRRRGRASESGEDRRPSEEHQKPPLEKMKSIEISSGSCARSKDRTKGKRCDDSPATATTDADATPSAPSPSKPSTELTSPSQISTPSRKPTRSPPLPTTPSAPPSPSSPSTTLVPSSPVEFLKDPDHLLPFTIPFNSNSTITDGSRRIDPTGSGSSSRGYDHPVIPEVYLELLDRKR